MIEQYEAQEFETEEEAQAYFDKMIAEEWSKTKWKRPKHKTVDTREQTDPYYAMLKEDKEIQSRYQNHFDIDDKDYFVY